MIRKIIQIGFVVTFGLLLAGLLLVGLSPDSALAQSSGPENPTGEEGESNPSYTAESGYAPERISGGESLIPHDCNFPANPIINCGFESGDFTGWITEDLSAPFFPLQVGGIPFQGLHILGFRVKCVQCSAGNFKQLDIPVRIQDKIIIDFLVQGIDRCHGIHVIQYEFNARPSLGLQNLLPGCLDPGNYLLVFVLLLVEYCGQ